MIRRDGLVMLAGIVGLAFWGCDQAETDRWHQENTSRWNEFWRFGDSGSGAGRTEVWTIECNAYEGPERRSLADRMATALKGVDRLQADRVWVEDGETQSRVFYGRYKLKYVRAKVDRESQAKGDIVIELNAEIKRDQRFIKTLAVGDRHPFFSARAIPQPTADVGPPEWDMQNAKGVYALHVGVTYATPKLHNYKQAAVEWVRALRADGHEAYFYHDPDEPRSSICVGTFGANALIDSGDGKTQYSAAVIALRGQSDFKYNLENGHRMYKRGRNPDTKKMERIPNWSFLVKIPRGGSAAEKW